MKAIRRNTKLSAVFLTILMLSITIPSQSVLAAMIVTEAMLDLTRAQQARDDINKLLLREDVQSALIAQGIDPLRQKHELTASLMWRSYELLMRLINLLREREC